MPGTLLPVSLAIQSLCLLASIALALIPLRQNELPLWRRLGLGRLRKRLTRRLRRAEPLAHDETVRTARRNIWWHVALTGALMIQGFGALADGPVWRWALGVVSAIPALAWLAGSLVQRQKMALIVSRHGPDARPRWLT